MSRFDNRPFGSRFDDNYEVNSIRDALEGQQTGYGTTLQWYRFDAAASTVDLIYDEGTRVYKDPIEIPVLSAIRNPGSDNPSEQGFYTTDTISVSASFDEIRRYGLWDIDMETDAYLLDRFVYDNDVWKPMHIGMEEGQVHTRRMAVTIEAREVDPAELVFEPQFAAYSE